MLNIIREIKTKTMSSHHTSIRMAKIPKLTIPNTDKNTEQQELSFISGGKVKISTAPLEYGSAVL